MLDYDYFNNFSDCFSQIIFDQPSSPSAMVRGFYLDSEHECYVYTHDIINLTDDSRLYVIHTTFDKYIGKSQYRNTSFSYGETAPYIVWKQTEDGLLISGTKYSKDDVKLSSEEYTFAENGNSDFFRLIIEKKKYDANGKLTETLSYTYADDGSCEVETETID